MSGAKEKLIRFDKYSMDSYNLDSYIEELLKFKQELLDDGFDSSKASFIVSSSFTITAKRDFTVDELKHVGIQKVVEQLFRLHNLKESYYEIINAKRSSINKLNLSLITESFNPHDKKNKEGKLNKLIERLDTYICTTQNIESFLNEFQNNPENLSLDVVTKFYNDSKKFVEKSLS